MSNIRVGLIGAGRWGRNHARTWTELGHLAVVGDRDLATAQAVGLEYGVSSTDNPDEILESDVDAVVIATPAATHAELAIRAIENGKHVLIEKPLALDTADAERIVTAAAASSVTVMVDHVLEYHPAVEKMKELLGNGELGRLLYSYSHRLNFGTVRTEEDALWSFAPHDLSLMLAMIGSPPSVVSCRGGSFLSPGVADVNLMSLDWTDGVRAYVFVSWLHPFKEHRFALIGDRNMAVFDDTKPWSEKLVLYPHRIQWMGGRTPVAAPGEPTAIDLSPAEPLRQACAHFAECVQSGAKPRTGLDNGLGVVRLLEAGRTSLDQGGRIVEFANE